MKVEPPLFFAIWAGLLTTHVAMFFRILHKLGEYKNEIADNIRRYNARQGYGQSVAKEELAWAYLTPFTSGELRKFAQINDLRLQRYKRELSENVGRRRLPIVGVIYQGAAVIISIAGLTYLVTSVPLSRETYLIGLGLLLLGGVGVYLFL